jgi:hypothetical protein
MVPVVAHELGVELPPQGQLAFVVLPLAPLGQNGLEPNPTLNLPTEILSRSTPKKQLTMFTIP